MQYLLSWTVRKGKVKSTFQVAVGMKVKSGERCRKGCHVLEVLGLSWRKGQLKQHGGSFESLQMRINSLFVVWWRVQ